MTISKRGDSSPKMLPKRPMSLKDAFSYLELSRNIEEAKKYVVDHFKDFTEFKKEVTKLPLSAVEAVLKSKGFRVDSEDDVYDFILEWARLHHPKIKERREILTKHLVPIICFPNMSNSKLNEVRRCPDFDHEQVSKLVMEGLFSKVELSSGQNVRASKELVPINCNFSRRVYKPRYTVYFDLKKKECKDLFPAKHLKSSEFCLGNKRLYLSAKCCKGEQHHHFGLFLYKVTDSETCTLDYEFAAVKKSSKKFKIRATYKNHTFDGRGDSGWGSHNLLSISWADFMRNDCDYFVDGILRLRAEIVLVNNTQP